MLFLNLNIPIYNIVVVKYFVYMHLIKDVLFSLTIITDLSLTHNLHFEFYDHKTTII